MGVGELDVWPGIARSGVWAATRSALKIVGIATIVSRQCRVGPRPVSTFIEERVGVVEEGCSCSAARSLLKIADRHDELEERVSSHRARADTHPEHVISIGIDSAARLRARTCRGRSYNSFRRAMAEQGDVEAFEAQLVHKQIASPACSIESAPSRMVLRRTAIVERRTVNLSASRQSAAAASPTTPTPGRAAPEGLSSRV